MFQPHFVLTDDSLQIHLMSGDGMITVSEFCKGLQQLKGQARAIDMVPVASFGDVWGICLEQCAQVQRIVES